jgi:glutamate---cysteine ligase / carboxylate-amine ligase
MELRTFGVEEELLLVGPEDGRPRPAGDIVVQLAADGAGELPPVDHEFKKEQAEIGSAPVTGADDLLDQLRAQRQRAADAAAVAGVRIAALATHPLPVRPTPTEDARYRRMTERFGLVARQQLTCGQHVHVGVASREEGIVAIDGIAPWLSVLVAMSANSPYWHGVDSGYASYRTMVWGLWPTAGATAPFGSVEAYDDAIAWLIESGAAMDDGMIYFDARLSARYPTVEIRVADVCTRVEDAVLVGVVARALVETAVRRGPVSSAPVRPEVLRGGAWRAAHDGLRGELLHVASRRTLPAAEVLGELLTELTPALRELELVSAGFDRLLRVGSGAEAQRASYAERGDLRDVVRDAVQLTLGQDAVSAVQ